MRKSHFQASPGLVLGQKGHADMIMPLPGPSGPPPAGGAPSMGEGLQLPEMVTVQSGEGFYIPPDLPPVPPPKEKKTYASFQFIWFFLGAVQTIQMFALALQFSLYVAFVLGHFDFWHCREKTNPNYETIDK